MFVEMKVQLEKSRIEMLDIYFYPWGFPFWSILIDRAHQCLPVVGPTGLESILFGKTHHTQLACD